MHFLDFLYSNPYYPGANVLNSIATIHIQANLLSPFLKGGPPNTSFREHVCGAEIKAAGSPYIQASRPKTTLRLFVIYSHKSVSTIHNRLLHIYKTLKQMGSKHACTSCRIYIHKCAHTPTHSHSHDLHCSLSSCRQTAAMAINVSQHSVSVSLSQFFFKGTLPGGKAWEGFGGGLGVQTQTIFPPSLVPQCFTARQTQSHVRCAFMN